jgi:hypothetical protein
VNERIVAFFFLTNSLQKKDDFRHGFTMNKKDHEMKQKLAYWILLTAAMLTFSHFAYAQSDKQNKIKDLKTYLQNDQTYQSAENPLDKLKILAKLKREKRVSYSDKYFPEELKKLTLAYMKQEGGTKPEDRLKAFSELTKMRGFSKPLNGLFFPNHLCSSDFIRYLYTNKAYLNASPKKKFDTLREMKKEGVWADSIGRREIARTAQLYIADETADLPVTEKYHKQLVMMSDMKKNKELSWGNEYSKMEEHALLLHTHHSPEYQNANLLTRLKILNEYKEKELITSFVLSDYQARLAARFLLNKEGFIEKSPEAQKKTVFEFINNRNLHTFSRNKLLSKLNLQK